MSMSMWMSMWMSTIAYVYAVSGYWQVHAALTHTPTRSMAHLLEVRNLQTSERARTIERRLELE